MKIKGVIFACSAGALWAVSGIMCQILFKEYLVSPEWLASTRLLAAGGLLTGISFFQRSVPRKNFSSKDLLSLVLFSLIGMLGVQYTYFKAIQYSGAAIATILQFTGPIFIFIFLVLHKEKRINLRETALLIVTFISVFLIVTKGEVETLNISAAGFVMGIASAITLAFYTIQPRKLLVKYGETRIAGLGMLIAGLTFQLIHPIWRPDFQMDSYSLSLVSSIIIFGTALPFLFQLSSLRFIEASLAGVLTVTEPILATLLSVLLFNSQFTKIQLLGFVGVIISVILLTRLSDKKIVPEDELTD
ncbi:DMT family transporter [Enterococcus xiangfangensis]|uniref:DMT family transporter n=1 Tax=Enterococcus xiangfangensis TaxID=1296537 RepID=UPI0010F47441|nr:DMT family transporter [Enterococcus xiangfangensis]MBM7710960.1 drug/metabolite transporter (DMT)-like permease [Enterococcus xiangfangensis]NBK07841.1 EamA family transporter [Enterococcus asini]